MRGEQGKPRAPNPTEDFQITSRRREHRQFDPDGLDAFFAFIPKLIGFLIVLLIGYIIARVVKGIVTKVLDKVGIDRALHSGSTGAVREPGGA